MNIMESKYIYFQELVIPFDFFAKGLDVRLIGDCLGPSIEA